ncbi:Sec-independent protein translocase protein TatC [Halobacterium hubeiense]|uniref:Sec-independent protein translocase protein TatC n=2 Tax=Halobacterium hubeiense TaxID=1407499 RepID=A0A0U5H6K3_9EURY|nr:twin-arginine translocase subunit TatC [Halobacterium hubeiense]CQH62186.1 Sec-independent protein translocase protein TatC [Halobacterium hubeiense]
MAEEPDGGRDRNHDWEGLAPAVRPADGADRGREWDDLTPAVRRVDDAAGTAGPRVTRDDEWRDLTPAVERVEPDDGDEWDWDEDAIAAAGGSADPASGGEPELLADEEHQADDPDEDAALDPRENSVVDAEENPAPPDDGIGLDAPESDVEEPLAVHVEEMVKRLAIVIAIAALVSVAVFPLTEGLITTIWNYVLPGGEAVDPRVYQPLELVITQVKVASLAGLVIALPVFVYESYAFMRPGLYKHERRYYLAAVPTSLVLAVLGVLFAYLLVLPYTMDYFQGYTEGTADVAFALGSTFNLILMVMGYLAVVFQIPLFMMLAIMLGVTTRQWLEDRRLLFWAAFAGISFTFGAIDPTGVVPIIVALTMIALFEGTLALLRWTGN